MILLKIENNQVVFIDKRGIKIKIPIDVMIQKGLIEFFSVTDAKKIVDASGTRGSLLTRLNGSSLWVPDTRIKYLSLFAIILTLIWTFSIPMAIKKSTLYYFRGSACFIFFPLSFILTDVINELYGYQATKRVIRYLAASLIMLAPIIQCALYLNDAPDSKHFFASDITSDEINQSFKVIFSDVPKMMLWDAFSLLIADTLNAYLFSLIRVFLTGKGLWLRSLISNLIAQFIFTLCWVLVYRAHTLTETQTWLRLVKAMEFKFFYFTLALPLIYSIRIYFQHQEEKTLVKTLAKKN